MGKDSQPKDRQARSLARRKAQRGSYDRILIVCEGSKTEPQYINEIRRHFRIHTANIQVHASQLGTQPMQVVEYALQLFTHGDHALSIQPRAFEQVYAMFDRDDHTTYHSALEEATRLRSTLRNDLRQSVCFSAIASVPCFELWLLLHFEDVLAPIHRTEVYTRLRRHIPDYDKGGTGYFERTRKILDHAISRANTLAARSCARDGREPYTDLQTLVSMLTSLRSES